MKRDTTTYASDGGAGQPTDHEGETITTHRQAREYAERCFKEMRLSPTAKLLLHVMACRWHPKHGWQRGQNSTLLLLGVSHDTAKRALEQLLNEGAICVIKPGEGRRAATYDFGPNAAETVEALYPENRDATEPGLYPSNVDTMNRKIGVQNPPLYPENRDAYGKGACNGEVWDTSNDTPYDREPAGPEWLDSIPTREGAG